MSCNGCRVLRKGCGEKCVLRSCLQWIDSPEAQGNATLFLAKFFGRSDLLSFISAVPDHHRPALFQSLLFEACGRTVNPVNGAVGLLSSGNWHVCEAAVETVFAGGVLRPIQAVLTPKLEAAAAETCMVVPDNSQYYYDPKQDQQSNFNFNLSLAAAAGPRGSSFQPMMEKLRRDTILLSSEESVMTATFGIGDAKERKLLNLFV